MTAPEPAGGADHDDGGQVRFDRARPERKLGRVVVSEMLMSWHERNPAQFGYWLAAALTGVEPAKTNRKAR